MRTRGNIVKRMTCVNLSCYLLKELFLVRMGKHASDRIINLKLYCTVNENVVLIFLLLGYIRQKNGEINQR